MNLHRIMTTINFFLTNVIDLILPQLSKRPSGTYVKRLSFTSLKDLLEWTWDKRFSKACI